MEMTTRYFRGESTLLTAPTGTGKTLSGFLPVLMDIARAKPTGIHTLYIAPLKALSYDIERNVLAMIQALDLPISVEARTGDTGAAQRRRQREKPPQILLTTPESLMLLLSYHDAADLFGQVECVIVDEIHQVAASKRGDLVALALAQLETYRPGFRRIGLSATVSDPDVFCGWLGPAGAPAGLLVAKPGKPPEVTILKTKAPIPYGGFMAEYAVPEILEQITQHKTAIIFVNTRAQAEMMFQYLWNANDANLPIGIYHASLTQEVRQKAIALMNEGGLRALVATSALELGIDWGDVDVVIQVGAPKGVSRLLQRIGRSNHKVNAPSKAFLAPANRFEVLECQAAMKAIAEGALDGDLPALGSQDVVIQFIMNCACSKPIAPEEIYKTISQSWSYRHLSFAEFELLFRFAADGGYALRNYDRWRRLTPLHDGRWAPISDGIIARHRQNIGVIIEAGKLKVKKLTGGRGGVMLGELEEGFGSALSPGDTFYFAGEVLAFERINDMVLEARASPATEPLLPSYSGGQMPMSTFLADGVRALLNDKGLRKALPKAIEKWLSLQAQFSQLPSPDRLLVECFPRSQLYSSVFYTFEGRKANQTLGMLISRRMERRGLHPLSFTVTDYGLAITSVEATTEDALHDLLSIDILADELEEWLAESPMLKRSFRRVATIVGLVEQQNNAKRKTVRQMTFSTDLIYDVLRKYEPDHVLLRLTRADAERELLDLDRLKDMLLKYRDRVDFRTLPKPTPLSLPVILDVRTERLPGAGLEALLAQANLEEEAERLIEEVENGLVH